MRLQFLPLILCLFLTTFGWSHTENVEIKSSSQGLQSLANAIHFSNTGHEFYDSSVSVIAQAEVQATSGTNFTSSNFNTPFPFSEIEANSYKNGTHFVANSAASQFTTFQQTASANIQVIFSQGLYYGFALMLILLNLVCFFLFEEKPFLLYSIALATLTAVFFFSDGLLTVLGFEPVLSAQIMQATLLGIAAVCAAVFASKYLTLEEVFPKLKWVTIGLFGIAGLLLFTSWVTNEVSFANAATTILFGTVSIYFMAGIFLFSKKNYAKFYVIATFIPLLFAIDFFVLRPMGIVFLSTETFHLKWAALAEMIILTYAIMYRMQAIKEENELRQAELRIFLKRQEAMASRKGTENLIEEVYLENLIMHYDLDGLEIKLLQYISEGKTNAKIARKLRTTEHDVEDLTKELYHKLEIGEHIQEDFRMLDSQPDYIYN